MKIRPGELVWQGGFHEVEPADGGTSSLRVQLLAGVLKISENGALFCGTHNQPMTDPSMLGTLECPVLHCHSRGELLVTVG